MADVPDSRPATDLRDIEGPLPVATLPPFLLSGGVLLLAAGLLFLRRRLPQEHAQPASTPTRAGEDAQAALAALVAEYRQGVCPSVQVLVRLDTLVRRHLDATADLPALHLTASEIVARAASHMDREQLTRLAGLLALCDLAKFAGHRADPQELEDALDLAGTLIGALPPGRQP